MHIKCTKYIHVVAVTLTCGFRHLSHDLIRHFKISRLTVLALGVKRSLHEVFS